MVTGWLLVVGASVVRGLMFVLGYVRNNKTFPQPLSREEEAKCLERMQDGHPEARERLISHNMRLVAHIVKKFDHASESTEDLISIGSIGLIKGIDTFDPDKGTRLATYCARCIENEILMHLRATKRSRHERYLEDPIGKDPEGNEITLMEIIPLDAEDVADQVKKRFQIEDLERQLDVLGERERRVIELRFGLHNGRRETQREIAEKLDISRSYVSRIEKKAVQKLAKAMAS